MIPNVLLVDCEPRIVYAIKRLLRKEPYNILVASSAKEVQKILSTQTVTVIILHEMMRSVLGNKLLTMISSEYPNALPVVSLANVNSEKVKRAVEDALSYKMSETSTGKYKNELLMYV